VFIDINQVRNVFIHVAPVDFRKGLIGLGVYIQHEFGNEKEGKNLYAFCNRTRDKVRIIYWDDTGFAMWHKVLENDKFRWPKRIEEELKVTASDLKYLLSGIRIDHFIPHKISDPKAFF